MCHLTKVFLLISFTICSDFAIGKERILPLWEFKRKSNGVVIEKGTIKGTGLIAFRGTTDFNFPLKDIFAMILDISKRSLWVDRMAKGHIIKTVNPYSRIEYNETKLPWPVANRDFVYQIEAQINEDGNSVELLLYSIDQEEVKPKKKLIRGKIVESSIKLIKLNPNKTKVVLTILADPKGSVPAWLVNILQAYYPSNSLSDLREILTTEKPNLDAFSRNILSKLP